MAKPSKNLDVKDIFSKFTKNTAWIFLAILLLVCIFDVLEVKKSADIILQAKQSVPATKPEHDIKIDFDGYYKVLQTKQEGQTYFPTTTPTSSPFGVGQ